MVRNALSIRGCLGVCVLVVLTNQGLGEDRDDPNAKANKQLQDLLKEVGDVTVKMGITTFLSDIKGVTATYVGTFQKAGKKGTLSVMSELRRMAAISLK